MKILFLALALPALAQAAQAPLEIRLQGAESAALDASSNLKASDFEWQAAKSLDGAAWTALWPRLGLDAMDRYNSHVTTIPFGGKPTAFGDYNNYSLGVNATWTLWDSGNAYNLYRALEAGEEAKKAELESTRRQVRLRARLSYFQAQLMAERARLVADSLRLAQSQAADIAVRLSAGASSRIDSLSSKNEVLQRRGQYRQARADLAGSLRDLFALTGLGAGADPSLPEVASSSDAAPADTEPATLALKLEGLEESLQAFEAAKAAGFNKELPQLQALQAAAESARRQANALGSGHWPRIQASFRSSLEYPDGPVLEQYQQNATTLSANWPLFAFGQVNKQVAEQEAKAAASEARAKALATDLERDWNKSRDRLQALRDQKSLGEQSVAETDNLNKLIYNAYQNGSSSLLEVQVASLHALEAKVQLASVEAQMLMELAIQSSLSE